MNTIEASSINKQLPLKVRLARAVMGPAKPVPTQEERKKYPVRDVNILSVAFFWWLSPLLKTGFQRNLSPNDMFYLDDKDSVEYLTARYVANFNNRVYKTKKKYLIKNGLATANDPLLDQKISALTVRSDPNFSYPKNIVHWTIFDTFFGIYGPVLSLRVIADLFTGFNPLLTRALIKFVEEKGYGENPNIGRGVGYAIGCSVFIFMKGFFMAHYFNSAGIVGAKVKGVLTKVLYDKAFTLDNKGLQTYSTGTLTSLMGTDLSRVELAFTYMGNLASFFPSLCIVIIFLCIYIGPVGLVGVAFFAGGVLSVLFVYGTLKKYRRAANIYTDLRVNYIAQVLGNLKIIKYYCWEDSYFAKIKDYRERETKSLLQMQTVRGIGMAITYMLPSTSSFIAFVCMYAVSGMKNVANIFAGLSFFNVLSAQAMMLPMSYSAVLDANIGLQRVGQVLCYEPEEDNTQALTADLVKKVGPDYSIYLDKCSFNWPELPENVFGTSPKKEKKGSNNSKQVDSKKMEKQSSEIDDKKTFNGTLVDINLKIKKGDFVVITGAIGSGKTSLLNAINGFMHKNEGDLLVNGSIVFCRTPWIQNATVRENIVFGNTFDQKKYDRIIYVCSLTHDLENLPAGDRTEIGERGVTLSGGQKARINLARSIYADTDIILLDDVLSAVDAKVGEHIMNNCFLDYLAQRTRVLATHQLSLIGKADYVVFLNGDGTIDTGTLQDLKATNEAFQNLMELSTEQAEEEQAEEAIEEAVEEDLGVDDSGEMSTAGSLMLKDCPTNTGSDDSAGDLEKKAASEVDGKITKTEFRDAKEGVSGEVYTKFLYLSRGMFGYFVFPLFIALITISTFSSLFTTVWLSYWTELKFKQLSNPTYEGIYGMFICVTIILVIANFWLISYMNNNAAKHLNIRSLDKILHVPMSYMDTTPMGRILNRFTKDTDVIDNEISDQLRLVIYTSASIFGVLILCIINLKWIGIAFPFLGFAYYGFTSYYLATSREIKIIEAAQRSFVYQNFSESLNGIFTIKSFGSAAINRFMELNMTLIDTMNESLFLSIAVQRWLAVRLSAVSCLFSFIVTMLCAFNVFHISAASAGLVVTYVLQISDFFSFVIRTATLLENRLTSAERLVEYAYHLPQESKESDKVEVPQNWPSEGKIEFQNVKMRYRPELPTVLQDFTMNIGAAEKIGVCGRTGAGKSSIMTALYRLVEFEGGSISIDGINISELSLKSLRSKLSIIPQEPVMFNGTIRFNLDPFGERSDDQLWDALRRSGLIQMGELEQIKRQGPHTPIDTLFKFHLDMPVEDEGSNFSLGERQLVSLARALVRDSKILILDEATSSVDYVTDSKIQNTIKNEFTNCTILCIAHRLNTILKYDRILVLEKGAIEELDTPLNLYHANGVFRDMCDKSAITEEDFHGDM